MPAAASPNGEEGEGGLPPPGSRWGAGAQSVLPYLTRTLQAKPAHESRDSRPRDGHPVFANWPPQRPRA